MNQRLSGKDGSAHNRKTSIGEGIRFYGYMYAIANNPGRPLRAMWNEQHAAGEKTTSQPPAMGRFGMSQNRFERLCHLHASAARREGPETAKTLHAPLSQPSTSRDSAAQKAH
mmetsp:Transcript_10388/g.23179  ORF Transcript_10388/g.23179 Transcript_10388/m.23179 type:complete len:113 (-) Transcript_10388:142-480(-)